MQTAEEDEILGGMSYSIECFKHKMKLKTRTSISLFFFAIIVDKFSAFSILDVYG